VNEKEKKEKKKMGVLILPEVSCKREGGRRGRERGGATMGKWAWIFFKGKKDGCEQENSSHFFFLQAGKNFFFPGED